MNRLNELLFQVQAIHAEGRPDIFKAGAKKYADEELEAIIVNDNTPIFVFEQNGMIAGYAFCIYRETKETGQLYYRKTLYIDDLCVDNHFRSQGVATKLYQYVVKTAVDNDCSSVTLNVWNLNENALRFYLSIGMTPLKTTMESRLK